MKWGDSWSMLELRIQPNHLIELERFANSEFNQIWLVFWNTVYSCLFDHIFGIGIPTDSYFTEG